MKKTSRMCCAVALTLFATQLPAQQQISQYPEITLAKCDDGTELKGTYITFASGLKAAGITDELPYLVLVDNDDMTHIYDKSTLRTLSLIKPRAGSFSQVTRDGYLMTKASSVLKADNVPTFYTFDGQKVWTCKNDIALSDRRLNVVVCYRQPFGKKWHDGMMVAYDLSTGRELWQRTIPHHRHFAWGDAFHQSGSPDYYLMADSLVRINVLTGDTVRHAFVAGVTEPLKSRFSIVRSRMPTSSAWAREARYSYEPMVAGAILTGTHSNWLAKGDTLFVADALHLYALSLDLKTLWQTPLPEGLGARSMLREDGNRLLLAGFGVAFQNGLIGRCGSPFTASYDKTSGRQLTMGRIDLRAKAIGGCVVPGRTYWQDDKGFWFTNEGDTTATRIDWKPKTDRQPKDDYPDRVICDTVGVLRDGKLLPVVTDARQLVVELYGEDVYVVHDDGTAEMLKAEDVYFRVKRNIYSNNATSPSHYVVVDPETRRVKQGFTTQGHVTIDKGGDLYIRMKQGMGIVRHRE